jgi:hypothetical protein
LTLASSIHAGVLAAAAWFVPWRSWTFFAVACALVALAHLAVALLSALRHRALGRVWRAASAAAMGLFAYLSWGAISTAWYVRSVYAGVGQAVAAALLLLLLFVAMLTLPLAIWGFRATGGIRPGRVGVACIALLLALGPVRLWRHAERANGTELLDGNTTALLREALASVSPPTARATRSSHLMSGVPVRCERPLRNDEVTLVATYLVPATGVTPKGTSSHPDSRCFQGDKDSVLGELKRALAEEALSGPVKLDVIERWAPLPSDALVAGLSLRPGIDGACRDDGGAPRCLMPWQLVALDAFNRHQLLAAVPDARIGASIADLEERLGPGSPVYRLSTASWLIDKAGDLREFHRDRALEGPPEPQQVHKAALAAQAYILRAQHGSGRFKYIVDPHTGQVENEPFSVARQAGTTLALCELGTAHSFWVRRAINRSLALLASLEQRAGDVGALRYGPPHDIVGMGATALSTAALLRCRRHVGSAHDPLIGRLARALLALQRDDGSFRHTMNVRDGSPVDGPGHMYVDGQIVLALVLLEQADGAPGNDVFPPRPQLTAAVERAMQHFGDRYWSGFVRPLFFIEENWHCIAAAAALPHHRHDSYEQLCLDYVRFKRRIVHNERAPRAFVGGYGIGYIVPPHNTATAGFGEALAAAILIKRVRGLDTTEDEAIMMGVHAFLLRNQWTPERCFACNPDNLVVGGFSEHMASPKIRIDYVQHAWAALGHGARALEQPWAEALFSDEAT